MLMHVPFCLSRRRCRMMYVIVWPYIHSVLDLQPVLLYALAHSISSMSCKRSLGPDFIARHYAPAARQRPHKMNFLSWSHFDTIISVGTNEFLNRFDSRRHANQCSIFTLI